jgi:hypothetical protein|uniref:Potassium channel tetramerisation domain containing 16 n=1 Tax=Mus musculus TaxID=10090 RepID=Q9D6G3_MOUSE|nr:unnamed protein product [Mus musculus]
MVSCLHCSHNSIRTAPGTVGPLSFGAQAPQASLAFPAAFPSHLAGTWASLCPCLQVGWLLQPWGAHLSVALPLGSLNASKSRYLLQLFQVQRIYLFYKVWISFFLFFLRKLWLNIYIFFLCSTSSTQHPLGSTFFPPDSF